MTSSDELATAGPRRHAPLTCRRSLMALNLPRIRGSYRFRARAMDGRRAHRRRSLWTRFFGAAAIAAARRQRCAALLRHARTHSPFYRDLWRDVPASAPQLADLPVVTKSALMSAFDDVEHRSRDPRGATSSRSSARAPTSASAFATAIWCGPAPARRARPACSCRTTRRWRAYDALVTAQLLGSPLRGLRLERRRPRKVDAPRWSPPTAIISRASPRGGASRAASRGST